jgi:hypothetical protein
MLLTVSQPYDTGGRATLISDTSSGRAHGLSPGDRGCWRTDELAETRRVAAMGWQRVPGRGDSQDQPAGMAAAAAWRSPPGTCCQPGSDEADQAVVACRHDQSG